MRSVRHSQDGSPKLCFTTVHPPPCLWEEGPPSFITPFSRGCPLELQAPGGAIFGMLPPLLPLVRPVSIPCATILSPSCLALDSEPLEGKATGEILLWAL